MHSYLWQTPRRQPVRSHAAHPVRQGQNRCVARASVLWLCFVALVGCSAEASEPTERRVLDVEDFANAAGTGGASESPTDCVPGRSRSCHCPDGSQSGSQNCLAGGKLGPCQGCRSGVATQDEPVDVAPIEDGALCDMLQGQGGCLDQSFRSDELPASILFLLDRSGSMLCNPPEFGQSSEECEALAQTKFPDQPTKWGLTVRALRRVFEGLIDSGTSAGLAFLSNNDVCGVHSRPAVPVSRVDAGHAAALASALSSTTPAGGTPIVGGAILAYAHLHEEAGLDASGGCAQQPCGAAGNRFVVLITDGADSCPSEPFDGACAGGTCTDFLLDHSVGDALRVNIRTFVIGAPGSEPARGFLSELALSGGTARNGGGCTGSRGSSTGDCHFDMTSTTDFAEDLSAALDEISGSAIGCEFPVPQLPDRAPTDNVNVQFRPGGVGAPQCIGLDEGPCGGGANGWQFGTHADGSADLSRVVLCGDACRKVQNDPQVQVDVVLGCQPIVLD